MVRYLTHVRDIENNKIGTVVDQLSVQFTAEFDGKIKFFFYQEQGVTWTPINEEEANVKSNHSRKEYL